MTDRQMVSSSCWDLIKRLEKTASLAESRTLSDLLAPLLIAYWDADPHSAMEALMSATFALPLPLSHGVVRRVVEAWKAKPNYHPDAGGGANHCYMSALIFSENYDLADREWAKRVLPVTLRNALDYPNFDRMRDGAAREQIVRQFERH